MSTNAVNPASLLTAPVSVHLLPDEGPKAIPVVLNFNGGVGTYTLDLTNLFQQQFISMIQTLFIDMSDPATQPMQVQVGTAGGGSPAQTITAKSQTQGYYQVLCQDPTGFTFTMPTAPAGIVRVTLINVEIPGVVWPTA